MAWTLRLAGWREGYALSAQELAKELTSIKLLLMRFGGGQFLPDAFLHLPELVEDCRLLVLEWTGPGPAEIHGVVGFELRRCHCPDPLTGKLISRRINMLRLLAVRTFPHRAKLALRLCLEAMLRGTVRSRYDNEDEPHVLGTLGVVLEHNEPALDWAAKLGPRVKILAPDAPEVELDPVLRLLRDYAEAKHAHLKLEQGCVFVIADRMLLEDAAILNLIGRDAALSGVGELDVYYDPTDPFAEEVTVAAANLARRNPVTSARMGLDGDPGATIWGPPEVPAMRIGGISGDPGWKEFSS